MNFLIIFLLLPLLGCGATKRRVDNLIKNLDTILSKSRAVVPSYLNNINQMQEATGSSNNDGYSPQLARHHVIPGSNLHVLFHILKKQRPKTLIQILKSLYYNLPAQWRMDSSNREYLEAIQCLDEAIEDAAITTETDIDKFCKNRIDMLYSLFYWRPDNIQIGPEARFRDFRDSYDYDCFYLLRGVEMFHNIAFREIVEEIIRSNTQITDRQNNLLLRINENMLSMRNVPRNFDPNEWMYLRITKSGKNECWHNRLARDSMNILEKTFDFNKDERKGFHRARAALQRESRNHIKSWVKLKIEENKIRFEDYSRAKKYADKIAVETNNHTLVDLVNKFLTVTNEVLGFQEFVDILHLYSNNIVMTRFRKAKNFLTELYKLYLSDEALNSRDTNMINDFDPSNNKPMRTILQILRKTKVSYGESIGYAVNALRSIIPYNVYFLCEYFGKDCEDELKTIFSKIDTDNVTSTVKDFKETHKRDDDDDDDDDYNDYYQKTIPGWYTYLSVFYKVFNSQACQAHLEEAMNEILDLVTHYLPQMLITPLNATCERVTRDKKQDKLLSWQNYYESMSMNDFEQVAIQRFKDGAFAIGMTIKTSNLNIQFNNSELWHRNPVSTLSHVAAAPSKVDLKKRKRRDYANYNGVVIFDKFHRPLIASFRIKPEDRLEFAYFNRTMGEFVRDSERNWKRYVTYGEQESRETGEYDNYNVDSVLCNGLQQLNLVSTKSILENTCWIMKSQAWYSWKDMLAYLTPPDLQNFIAMEFLDGSFAIGVYKPYMARKGNDNNWITDEWAIPKKWPSGPIDNFNANGPFYGMIVFDRRHQPVIAMFRENIYYIHTLVYTLDRNWIWSPFNDVLTKWFLTNNNLSLADGMIPTSMRLCAGQKIRYF